MTLLDDLFAMTPDQRRAVYAGLSDEYRVALAQALAEAEAQPYFRFRGDPLAFVTHGLGEATYSKQREVLEAIPKHQKVVVAASHSTGKSFIASRAAAAVVTSWPADMVKVQTTATNFRQVKGILWPYIARLHAQYELPGDVFTTSWKIGKEVVGEGFSARHTDEASVSGFHAMGELFLIVDEGGGIHPTLGQAFTNVMTGNGHMLVIGNFPTDDDDTWFNRIWNSDEWHPIRISAFDTPNFTGEKVGVCTVCPPSVERHTIAKHLTDKRWVDSVEREFGKDSPYYQTRVLALPAKNIVAKTLPITWLEAVFEAGRGKATPGPVKLGCDIAADGGDEFVIAKMVGWRVSIAHRSAGVENQNTMEVAGVILQQIREAEEYHATHGITVPVRVKVDENGIGRGVADQLKLWGKEGKHGATIVGSNSSRTAHDTTKFKNQRSEMWWTVRELIQPNPDNEDAVLLQIDGGKTDDDRLRLLAQLNAPRYASNSAGQVVVQPKPEIKAATGHSPDRADAVLLAVYEPPEAPPVPSVSMVVLTQSNPWQTARA